jgi:hypothetical protein
LPLFLSGRRTATEVADETGSVGSESAGNSVTGPRWNKSKIQFYRKKYEDLTVFLRKGYGMVKRPKRSKLPKGEKQVSHFWRKDWERASDVPNTVKTSHALGNLRNTVTKVVLDMKKGIIVDVGEALYSLYGDDFVWHAQQSRELPRKFPLNISFDVKTSETMLDQSKNPVEHMFVASSGENVAKETDDDATNSSASSVSSAAEQSDSVENATILNVSTCFICWFRFDASH